MSKKRATATAYLQQLIGVWRGVGEGEFPGINNFRYRETLTFEQAADRSEILYRQNAILIDEAGADIKPSHLECGILEIEEDGGIVLHNAQNGRVEIMRGSFIEKPTYLELKLEATAFAGDPRMHCSARSFQINGNRLHYDMSMQTSSTDASLPHLRADLEKER